MRTFTSIHLGFSTACAGLLLLAGCDSVAQLTADCERGTAAACAALSDTFRVGKEVPADPARAASYASKACDGNELLSCARLSVFYRVGRGVERDPEAALRYAERACDGKEPHGCTALGVLHWRGIGVRQDETEAARLFGLACKDGDPAGCVRLGYLYAGHSVLPPDHPRALQLYSRACDAQDAEGCAHLAYAYRMGLGAAVDLERSVELARKSCDLGAPAGCNLSEMYRYTDRDGSVKYVRDPAQAPADVRDTITRVGPPPGHDREVPPAGWVEPALDPAAAEEGVQRLTRAGSPPAAAAFVPTPPVARAARGAEATAPPTTATSAPHPPRVRCETVPLERRMFPSNAAYLEGGSRPRWREFDRIDGENVDPVTRLAYDVRQQRAVVCVPEIGEPLGVLLHVDAGESPGLPGGWDAVLARHRLIFAAPIEAGNTKPRMQRIGLALDTLATVEANHAVDRSRVYASGVSGGGATAVKMALNYPEIFGGALSHVRFVAIEAIQPPGSNGYPSEAPYLTDTDYAAIAGRGLRFAWITGPGDPNRTPILVSQRSWQRRRLESRVFDIPGMSHTVAAAEDLEIALQWVEDRGSPGAPAGRSRGG